MTIALYDMVFVLDNVVMHEEDADRGAACVIHPGAPAEPIMIHCSHSFSSHPHTTRSSASQTAPSHHPVSAPLLTNLTAVPLGLKAPPIDDERQFCLQRPVQLDFKSSHKLE